MAIGILRATNNTYEYMNRAETDQRNYEVKLDPALTACSDMLIYYV